METQAEYWDRVASEKQFTHELNWLEFKTYVPQSASILDIGCGYGRMVQALSDHGYLKVRGIDPSRAMIERGLRTNQALDLVYHDTLPYPVESSSIDACLLNAVLTCIPKTTDQQDLLHEVHRVLKPRGYCWITDLWIQDDERHRKRYEEGLASGWEYGVFRIPEGAWLRHHTREHLDQLTAGLNWISTTDVTFQTMNGNVAHGFRLCLQKPAPDAPCKSDFGQPN